LPILYSAGIGPLIGSASQKKIQKILSRSAYISLRDADSKRLLSTMGIDPALLFDGADPALLMPAPPPSRAHAILREHGISPAGDLVCVVLRNTEEQLLLTRLFPAALRILSERHGLLPIFLTLDPLDGDSLLRRSARACGGILLPLLESSDAVALFSVSRLVLSMRLHALIFAAAAGTPAVGIPADPRDQKIPSFARAVGQEFLALDELTVGNLVERMEAALSMSEANRPILADSVAEMRKKARKDLANILLMIYNRYKNDEHMKKGWTSL
jgi:polysaccharide pyruvyl transferase WcaK-like protein